MANSTPSFCPSPQQNKEEPDKEEDKTAMAVTTKPTGAKRGRPQIRTTPNTSRSSVSKTPSTERRPNGKSSRAEMASNMANGDSKRVHFE